MLPAQISLGLLICAHHRWAEDEARLGVYMYKHHGAGSHNAHGEYTHDPLDPPPIHFFSAVVD
jgi:hypothetical protein